MATLSAYIAWVVTTWTLFGDWQVPLWVATIVGMVFGFVLGAATEVFIVRPLAKKSPLAVFVALDRPVPRHQRLRRTGSWGAPPPESDRQPVPERARRLRPPARHGVALRGHRHPRRHARRHRRCCSCCSSKTKVRAGDAGGGQQPRVGTARRHPDRTRSSPARGASPVRSARSPACSSPERRRQVTPTMMFTIFVYASAAATLGGLDSPGGAVSAASGIGVVENVAAEFAPGWIGQEMKLSVALLCIFVVLLVKPSGLFGTAKVERV